MGVWSPLEAPRCRLCRTRRFDGKTLKVPFATAILGRTYRETCAEASFGTGRAPKAVSRIQTFARTIKAGFPAKITPMSVPLSMAIISSRIAKPPNRLVRIREWRFLCGPTCPETLERPKGSRTQSGRPVTKSGAVSAILPCRAVSTPISAVSRVAGRADGATGAAASAFVPTWPASEPHKGDKRFVRRDDSGRPSFEWVRIPPLRLFRWKTWRMTVASASHVGAWCLRARLGEHFCFSRQEAEASTWFSEGAADIQGSGAADVVLAGESFSVVSADV